MIQILMIILNNKPVYYLWIPDVMDAKGESHVDYLTHTGDIEDPRSDSCHRDRSGILHLDALYPMKYIHVLATFCFVVGYLTCGDQINPVQHSKYHGC